MNLQSRFVMSEAENNNINISGIHKKLKDLKFKI